MEQRWCRNCRALILEGRFCPHCGFDNFVMQPYTQRPGASGGNRASGASEPSATAPVNGGDAAPFTAPYTAPVNPRAADENIYTAPIPVGEFPPPIPENNHKPEDYLNPQNGQESGNFRNPENYRKPEHCPEPDTYPKPEQQPKPKNQTGRNGWLARRILPLLAVVLLVAAFLGLRHDSGRKQEYLPEERVLLTDFTSHLAEELGAGWQHRVSEVAFHSDLEDAPRKAFDVSELGNQSVLAWLRKSDGGSVLHIGALGGVYAPGDCSDLFKNYTGLRTLQNFAALHTDNVTDMTGMFENCGKLCDLNMTGMNIRKVNKVKRMFYATPALKEVKADFDLMNTDHTQFMDEGDKYNGLPWREATAWGQCRMDRGHFELGLKQISPDVSQIVSLEFGDSIGDRPKDAVDISVYRNGLVWMWGQPQQNGIALTIAAPGGVYSPGDCNKLFCGLTGLQTFDGGESFHTENATNMSEMFEELKNLRTVDVTGWDTSKVTNMKCMFFKCESLEAILGIEDFKTQNVLDMSFLFSNCYKLRKLPLGKWNTSKVVSMRAMFQCCHALTELNVSNFDTANVTDMGWMFYQNRAVQCIDVSGFDTGKVTVMRSMFHECSQLTGLDLRSFETGLVEDFSYMLNRTPFLRAVEGNFNVSKCTASEYFMDNGDTFNGKYWQALFQ